jgi:hypothetical protein
VAYQAFTDTGNFSAAINTSGTTSIIVASDQTRTATAPVSGGYSAFRSADNTGTTNDPKLVITSAPGISGQPTNKRWGGIPFAGRGQSGRW